MGRGSSKVSGATASGGTARASIPAETIQKAVSIANDHRGSTVDLDNREITVVYGSGVTVDEIMGENMLGRWFEDNGFNASYEVRDVQYTTKPTWINYRGSVRSQGHTATLRRRLVGTYTW